MDWTTAHEASHELKTKLVVGRPYVLIVGGREHNVLVEEVGEAYIFGRVALNRVVALIDRPGRGGAVVKVVAPQDEKSAVGLGDELVHSEPCVIGSKPGIRISIKSVEIFEDPWRPFLPESAFLCDGSVDPAALILAIPAFAEYYITGQGFSGSPAAWTKPTPKFVTMEDVKIGGTVKLTIADDADDSSSGQ